LSVGVGSKPQRKERSSGKKTASSDTRRAVEKSEFQQGGPKHAPARLSSPEGAMESWQKFDPPVARQTGADRNRQRQPASFLADRAGISSERVRILLDANSTGVS
jgi:hypothetical protein